MKLAHDCPHCDGTDLSLDAWSEKTGHWYCPYGNDNCLTHQFGLSLIDRILTRTLAITDDPARVDASRFRWYQPWPPQHVYRLRVAGLLPLRFVLWLQRDREDD